MALREIVFLPDPVLRRKAHKVNTFDSDLQVLIDDMIETMREAPGVGLAAPQVGVLQRVIVVEYAEDEEDEDGPNKLYVLVNPEIVQFSKETELGIEGCLSVPGLVASSVLITTFYNGVLLTHLPDDRTLYNLSLYLNEHVPAQAALYQQGGIDPRLAFYINRLPAPIEDDQLDSAPSPAWLLRHAPLPVGSGATWKAVLESQSLKGKNFYLYQR